MGGGCEPGTARGPVAVSGCALIVGAGKLADNKAVAGDVAGNFTPPVRPVGSRDPGMLWAAVPEAAVNEDGQALSAKDEIGVAGKRLVATPAGNAGGAKDGSQL